MISLEYHQTLDAGAGHHVEEAKEASMAANQGKYLLVVEGSIPTKNGGICCKITDKTTDKGGRFPFNVFYRLTH